MLSSFYRSLILIKQSPLTIAGIFIVGLVIIVGILAPVITPYPPMSANFDSMLKPPSKEHFFGTDHVGRDVLSRVIAGTRISVQIGLVVLAIVVSIGLVLGLTAGYWRGVIDTILMRITDVFLAFPSLVLAIALSVAIGGGMQSVMVAITVSWWPYYARLVRSLTVSQVEEEYIVAARAIGAGNWRIIVKHLLPNCLGPILVLASNDMGWVILTAAGLGFIGVGVQPPVPEWGAMISSGRTYILDQWWVATFPGLAILITVLGYSLLGDGLRDIFDPHIRRGGQI